MIINSQKLKHQNFKTIIVKIILIALIFCFITPICAYAKSDSKVDDSKSQQEYDDYISQFDLSFFKDKLDKDTYSVLQQLGVDDFDYNSITSLSVKDIVNILKKIVEGKLENPIKSSLTILAFIILSSFFQGFKTNMSEEMANIYSTATSLTIAVILAVKVSSAISICGATIKLSADFIYAFVPIFCTIVATSGGITTSFSTNSLLLMLAQGVSFISSTLFVPIINCFLAIGICSGLRSELRLEKLMYAMKKCITCVISICAAGFVSILSIKTAVASRADALGLRSIRFAINSVIPVIGSAISEGLLSIQSYSSLIKSSVGVVGIIAVAFVFLPSIIETVVWRFFLFICMTAADVFGDNSVSTVLKAFSDVMLLITVVLVLTMMTTVISIGILVAAKTN